tara:strand:- start:1042 stop:1287 length:246 start_codon:yes stop_codon:yes gene_type:complete
MAKRHKGVDNSWCGRGTHIEVRNNDVNKALRRLKKIVNQEGIIKEVRDRQHYVKPSEKRAKAKAQGRKRWLKLVAKKANSW